MNRITEAKLDKNAAVLLEHLSPEGHVPPCSLLDDGMQGVLFVYSDVGLRSEPESKNISEVITDVDPHSDRFWELLSAMSKEVKDYPWRQRLDRVILNPQAACASREGNVV